MKFIAILVLGLIGLFVVIQLVPYGRSHTNPPVLQEYPWPSPEAKAIAQRACYDCHSNETTWYWYTGIAPFSWLIQRDVDEGRAALNFSEWVQGRQQETRELGEVIQEGEMPPLKYALIHPSAKLSATEKDILLSSVTRSGSGINGPEGEEEEEGEGGD